MPSAMIKVLSIPALLLAVNNPSHEPNTANEFAATLVKGSFACRTQEEYLDQLTVSITHESEIITEILPGCTYTAINREVTLLGGGELKRIRGLSGGDWWTYEKRLRVSN